MLIQNKSYFVFNKSLSLGAAAFTHFSNKPGRTCIHLVVGKKLALATVGKIKEPWFPVCKTGSVSDTFANINHEIDKHTE